MAKNAYEIRLDTLHLARDILSENRHIQLDVWKESREKSSEDPPDLPTEYGVTEVLVEAEKLYAFIERGKDDKKS